MTTSKIRRLEEKKSTKSFTNSKLSEDNSVIDAVFDSERKREKKTINSSKSRNGHTYSQYHFICSCALFFAARIKYNRK